MPFAGAEEAYYGMPFRGQGAVLDQLNQGTRQKLNQSRWNAEEGIANEREKWAGVKDAFKYGQERYDKNYDRAYGEKQDERTETRMQAQDKRLDAGERRLDAEEGRQGERHGWDKELAPIRLEDAKSTMEQNQRTNRLGAEEEGWGSGLYDDKKPELGSRRTYGRNQTLRQGDASIASTEAGTRNSNAQSRLALTQSEQITRANNVAEAQSRLAGIATQGVALQQQHSALADAKLKAEAAGDTQGAMQAEAQMKELNNKAIQINRDLAEAEAFYRNKGLTDFDLKSAYLGAQGDATKNQRQSHELFKVTDEGQEFSRRKDSVDQKLVALRKITSEQARFKSKSYGADQQPLDNIKRELEGIGYGRAAEDLDGSAAFGLNFEGAEGFTSREYRVNQSVNELKQDVERELADVKARAAATKQPLVMEEVRRLEDVLGEINKAQGDANGELNIYGGGGRGAPSNAGFFSNGIGAEQQQPQQAPQPSPAYGVQPSASSLYNAAPASTVRPQTAPISPANSGANASPAELADFASRHRRQQVNQPFPATGARR